MALIQLNVGDLFSKERVISWEYKKNGRAIPVKGIPREDFLKQANTKDTYFVIFADYQKTELNSVKEDMEDWIIKEVRFFNNMHENDRNHITLLILEKPE